MKSSYHGQIPVVEAYLGTPKSVNIYVEKTVALRFAKSIVGGAKRGPTVKLSLFPHQKRIIVTRSRRKFSK